ncbi:metallophosphoesterase family protein [Roseobacter litoralis]|uniref:Calcineurin-like phosphoesterase domain-containing protein n=1 Tax=Roseobacter litoralis (strain ATCC 49566 / DSM 6996 / JCM 21268 / NBRC 15278 / OCh 149) TaxID=391595 RepID=F7ZEJ7_ROSLO|nr:metallophosphoesterase family protein [Roseobacter litoralis]AEI95893.1 hypothetical protein RLO149_c039920 [Roseobacter litoralis Och 149]
MTDLGEKLDILDVVFGWSEPSQLAVIATAFDQLEERQLNWLREKSPTLWLSEDVFACHGTPTSDTTYWLERVSPEGEVILRSRNEGASEAYGVKASPLLFGHSHLPRRMDLPDGRMILNPGSVGCSDYVDDTPVRHVVQTGTSAACHAVAGKTTAGWATAFLHVPNDPSRRIELAKCSGHSNWEKDWLRAG